MLHKGKAQSYMMMRKTQIHKLVWAPACNLTVREAQSCILMMRVLRIVWVTQEHILSLQQARACILPIRVYILPMRKEQAYILKPHISVPLKHVAYQRRVFFARELPPAALHHWYAEQKNILKLNINIFRNIHSLTHISLIIFNYIKMTKKTTYVFINEERK